MSRRASAESDALADLRVRGRKRARQRCAQRNRDGGESVRAKQILRQLDLSVGRFAAFGGKI